MTAPSLRELLDKATQMWRHLTGPHSEDSLALRLAHQREAEMWEREQRAALAGLTRNKEAEQ